jgi:predicted RNA methylase
MDKMDEETFLRMFAHVKIDQTTNGEKYMMSTREDANNTTHLMKQYCNHFRQNLSNLTIADAFACLGGNTYSFSNSFKHVDAYEIDPTRCRNLQENVNNYPQKAKVSVKCQDCTAEGGILHNQYDVVFLDPPWLNLEVEPPRVDNKVFEDAFTLCTRIAQARTAKYIFIKLPIKAKDNPKHNFEESLNSFLISMRNLWVDIWSDKIYRRKRNSKNAAYTIVYARLKDPPAHAPAAAASTTDHVQPMAVLLTQLHACQFLHENTQ